MSFKDAAADAAERLYGLAKAVAAPGGAMDRLSESARRALSPQSRARPPLVCSGFHDEDGVERPCERYLCPWCGELVAPDAIDYGDGINRPNLPGWCPTCGIALGSLEEGETGPEPASGGEA